MFALQVQMRGNSTGVKFLFVIEAWKLMKKQKGAGFTVLNACLIEKAA